MPKTCKNNALVEYCSYKGLTQKDILQCYCELSNRIEKIYSEKLS